MFRSIGITVAIAVVAGVTIIACTNTTASEKTASPTETEVVALDSAGLVKRGDYLVNAMGCDDCHSPKTFGPQGPQLIQELRFSGFPQDGKLPPIDVEQVKKGWTLMSPDLTSAVGPWGVSYGANITSDPTGIGSWTEEQFLNAIKKGKYKGLDNSRPLLPPMPWFVYKNLTDEDLKAIFAYLKTTKPVKNVPPAPKPISELN